MIIIYVCGGVFIFCSVVAFIVFVGAIKQSKIVSDDKEYPQ